MVSTDANGNTIISQTAQMNAALCTENPDAGQQDRIKSIFQSQQMTWYDKLYDGYVKGFWIALGNDELLGFNGVIDNLAKILIFSLVAPFIAIMVSLASAKVLSPMLGGDVEIAGLTRLI